MKPKQLEAIAKLLHERTGAGAVYVFGTFASGRSRPDSDLDLAVMTSAWLDDETLISLKAEIGVIAGRDIDLIEFARAPEPLQAEIIRQGKLLAVWDEDLRSTQIMRALSRYQRLNEERRPVLERRLGKDGWKRLS